MVTTWSQRKTDPRVAEHRTSRGSWLGCGKGAQSTAAARQPVNGCRKEDIVTYRGWSRLKAGLFYGLTPPTGQAHPTFLGIARVPACCEPGRLAVRMGA